LTTIFKKCTVADPSQGIHRNPPMYPLVRNLAQGQLFASFPSSRYAAYILGEKSYDQKYMGSVQACSNQLGIYQRSTQAKAEYDYAMKLKYLDIIYNSYIS
jgi:hypothetical protein